MARGPRYFVPFRRRRDGKTDYYARTRLVVSEHPRMVVRRTGRHVIAQLVVAGMDGDRTLVAASSAELRGRGYTGSLSNTPAAYLTGMLCGVRAVRGGYDCAVLDIGLHRATVGARVFAALRGAVEAGLDIAHDEAILPDAARLLGEHIAAYSAEKAGIVENVKQVAEAIRKEIE
ncbi:MAG: 50S ribosomal protein L18 [Methanomicrobiales archaeon]|nr:50S ribosomal protein L18 [Methanomicrobiales archaeon]MDI6875937.1 50S ribosomal protein L18 [Methanomicrobiales archaeon]